METKETYDYQFKIILIGDAGVGKSNLLLRYCKNDFNLESTTTIGVEFGNRMVLVENKMIKAQIWDTCGQEQFKAIAKTYYKGAAAVLLVYDITRRQTFLKLEKWYQDIQENVGPNVSMMLIGNKSDLKHLREVKPEEAQSYAEKRKMNYMETSALDSSNVELAFQGIITEAFRSNLRKEQSSENSRNRQDRVRISTKPKPDRDEADSQGGSCC